MISRILLPDSLESSYGYHTQELPSDYHSPDLPSVRQLCSDEDERLQFFHNLRGMWGNHRELAGSLDFDRGISLLRQQNNLQPPLSEESQRSLHSPS